MDGEPLRRTALFDVHRALGARIVPFGGFEMPVQYAGILAEHDAVRKRAGLFDLSHMAQFELRGADVAAWADELTVNHVATMKPLQARYNIFTNAAGGAHDDVIFYRLAGRWLLIVNAGNADKMWAYLQAACRGHVALTDLRGETALLAVQGPRSAEVLAPLVEADIAALKYYTCVETKAGGAAAIVARTGYTGEDGFEVFLAADAAQGLWDALLADHRDVLAPCGLGARDVLRLEAGMPLYGHELTEEITPLQAGLGWAVKFGKPAFTGKAALEAQAVDGDYPRIAGIVLDGRVPARAGYRVLRNGAAAGEIRSGSIAPSVGNKSIATALVDAASAVAGTRLGVEVRGTEYPATTVPLPFYKRG
ncbi:MAG TPA: glycine cleavage system aminomethyltransferase GcvT [Candidatus Lustribacter sp.]|nr:glycine cleavage system aminomethyltransferase GcvT [Candidatus Lustribacter sp.]